MLVLVSPEGRCPDSLQEWDRKKTRCEGGSHAIVTGFRCFRSLQMKFESGR